MSLLSAAFYGYPQNELTVIGVTGTKGKTTTSYFTQALINAVSGGKAYVTLQENNAIAVLDIESQPLRRVLRRL